jgi:hypothetical protein
MVIEQTSSSDARNLAWFRLGHQQLGCERLPSADQLWPLGIVRILRDRREPVETLAKVADKTMSLTEALRSARRLAAAKYFESSFEMLVIALDSLLLRFPSDVLDLREYLRQSRRISGGFVGGHRVRCHPRVRESGAEESHGGFGVALLPEQHLDHLPVLIDRTIDVAPVPGHFDVRLIH